MKDEPVFEYHAEEAVLEIELPDNSKKQITIKSGWSFGTGGHETTRLCLKALEGLFKTERIERVLDIGCGSGVLSIASSMLGASYVDGIDIDSSIIEEARVNAFQNDPKLAVQFFTIPIFEINKTYNLVAANILLKTILSFLDNISERVESQGYFIASGIKDKDRNNAAKSIEEFGFKLQKTYTENEWVALVFQKTG